MWIFTRNGFVSIVQPRKDFDSLMVRSRCKLHLAQCFPNHKKSIVETKERDYRYRIFCTKAEVKVFLENQVDELDYDNFKNSVKQANQKKGPVKTLYERALTGVWYEMLVFQETLYGDKEDAREEPSAGHYFGLVPKIKRGSTKS